MKNTQSTLCSPSYTTGPIYRIHIGPRLGTARIIYYNKQSAKAAEDELHFSDLDGISIIVRKPSIYDIKDSFKISTTFPIMPFLSRRAFSAGSPSSITSKLASGNSTADTAHRDTSTLIKRTYNHASGHRATCGIGPVPYGLSAKAEPFTPKNPSSNSGNQTIAHEQPDEASLNNPIIIRSVSQPLKFMHPCQLILYNVPLNLNAQSFYLALRNTLLKKCPGESIKLLEATIASDTATGISQGIGFVKLENTLQTDLAMKVLNGAYLSGYEEEEGLLPLQVKIFSPKEIIEEALFKKRQQEDDQSMKEDNEKKRLGASSSVISISSSSSTSSSKPNKYLNLLSIALNDIDPMTSKGIFTSNREKLKFSNLLMDKLPEDEIKKCILEENYLIKKCLALKILFIDADDEVENKVDKNGDDNDAIAQREDYSEDAIKLVEKGNRDKLDSNDGSSKADDPEVGTKNPEATFAIRGYDREKSSAVSDEDDISAIRLQIFRPRC